MTDILHITDRERTQAAVIRALESARDEMAKRIEALTAERDRLLQAVEIIAALDPSEDSDEGYNEWGEADCFNQAQQLARAVVAAAPKPIWDQLADIGASDPQAWDKP